MTQVVFKSEEADSHVVSDRTFEWRFRWPDTFIKATFRSRLEIQALTISSPQPVPGLHMYFNTLPIECLGEWSNGIWNQNAPMQTRIGIGHEWELNTESIVIHFFPEVTDFEMILIWTPLDILSDTAALSGFLVEMSKTESVNETPLNQVEIRSNLETPVSAGQTQPPNSVQPTDQFSFNKESTQPSEYLNSVKVYCPTAPEYVRVIGPPKKTRTCHIL